MTRGGDALSWREPVEERAVGQDGHRRLALGDTL
jgi:hypothetical protein